MIRILACVTQQHDLWLVLLAALICVAACAGVFVVLDGLPDGKHRRRWNAVAAILAGGGTWATHFVAMLGYAPGLAIGFDMPLTLLSALVSIAGSWLAFEIFDRRRGAVGRIASGLVLGASIALMHFVGMAGLVAGADLIWSANLVFGATTLSAGFALAALHVFALAPSRFRVPPAATLLTMAIVSLHFTGMGALTLSPNPALSEPVDALDRSLLAVTIATGAAGALLLGVILALADRKLAATELAAARQATELAKHDALTGLPNRRFLYEALDKRLSRPREGERLAVVAVDLDRFKPVNDLYGHAAGDLLLQQVGDMLSSETRGEGEIPARVGGDEFILLLNYQTDAELSDRLSTLVGTLQRPIQLGDSEINVGATLGIALAPQDGDDASVLLRRADVALYRAKADGRGRFAFYERDMDARLAERAALERDLRRAIKNDEIVPYFQPLVDLRNRVVSEYEVLARWSHATRGAVSPDQFIPIAEEIGLIGELTLKVLRRACQEALHWTGAPRIAVNIAPMQLQDTALPQKIMRVLTECGFPAARLEVEITEDALVSNIDSARALLNSLRGQGVRISLDDFGTGYSSLRHLRELPFDALKIDRSFVLAMGESDEALSIVKTIVQLARSLGLSVTAEGIETKTQALTLQALGCDRGQGFYLGRPQPAQSSQSAGMANCA